MALRSAFPRPRWEKDLGWRVVRLCEAQVAGSSSPWGDMTNVPKPLTVDCRRKCSKKKLAAVTSMNDAAIRLKEIRPAPEDAQEVFRLLPRDFPVQRYL